MIARIISACLKNRSLTLLGAALVLVFGLWTLLKTPVDAIPDLSDNQLIVYTMWEGRSPKIIEDQVTYRWRPISRGSPTSGRSVPRPCSAPR